MRQNTFLAFIVLFTAVFTPFASAASPTNTMCPVSHEEVNPNMTIEHEGKTIAFCCKKCMKEFQKNPAKYAAAAAGTEAVAADMAQAH